MTTDHTLRLQALRDALKLRGLDGFLVPMEDEYQSEYAPAHARRLRFLSGFTGSAGFIVVLTESRPDAPAAAFFTDSRYTLQASQQLASVDFALFDSAETSPSDWLKANTAKGMKIGFDPWLHTANGVERLGKALAQSGAELVPVDSNPIDAIWTDRPAPSTKPIRVHELAYAGKSSAEKRQSLAAELTRGQIDAAVITDPASVAWLLNVRGDDVPHTPLPLSFAILKASGAVAWFVDPRKITGDLDAQLGGDVTRCAPDAFPAALRELGAAHSRVRIDPSEAAHWIVAYLQDSGALLDRGDDPCVLPKACKNATELDGMRNAHRRDGAALTKFLCWLDANVSGGALTELVVEEKLAAFRAANDLYRGPSFGTIAGAGPNGAIVHYRATPESNRALESGSLLLLDSGGQYLDGTTDVTRTVALGEPSADMRDRFTRVLKGHIALASIRFPAGTTGAELDVLARQHLWAVGLDYGHGTGHGVGSYLGVHEGPQGISRRNAVALKPGMVLSNEPGFYKPGAYGIRIENLQTVVALPEVGASERAFLGFEPLTLAPIDRRCIDLALMTAPERAWLNAYHALVREALTPLMDDTTAAWLREATAGVS